jgi:cell division protease FtsH
VRSSTRFTDVAGIDEIREEVLEIAEVLREPARFERVGATLPKGIILHGPPGTGKTLLAKAVAGEAGVPFFSASGSEFVEVYSGLGSKRIRALFAAARKQAPSVVYIDEIDAVGARRTGHASSGEREQTLDQLLAEMDGFATDPEKPVVVLASTNRLDDLDPALVRSGRFDRKIAVGLPGRDARREILDVHLRGRPLAPGTSAAAIAAFTVGMAGADLAALCNEAAFEAARARTGELSMPHFRRALMRLAAGPERRGRLLSEDERHLVAYHEMGHALVGHMSPRCDTVERVTVIPQGQALGVTISLPTEDRFLATREECVERLAMMMAGRAAEELVFGEFTSGAGDDLRRAAALARRMVGELAMGAPTTVGSLARGLPDAPGSEAGERCESAATELVDEAFRTATRILREHLELLHEAAGRLLEAEALERDEIAELFGPRPEARRLVPTRR